MGVVSLEEGMAMSEEMERGEEVGRNAYSA